MKKNKVKAQLRKIATRDAIEKRRNSKPADPFLALMLSGKNRIAARPEYDNYDDEEENDYGY